MENHNEKKQDVSIDHLKSEIEIKLKRALVLKDFAIENNYDVPEDIIEDLGEIQENFTDKRQSKVIADIDKSIKTITQMIFPSNYESILIAKKSGKENFDINSFKNRLFLISSFVLFTAILSFFLLCDQRLEIRITASVLSVSLGSLGALVYIMFNLVGIINESAFNAKDTYSNYIRILLGAILGWIFYFVFAQDEFNNCDVIQEKYLYLFVPFLVGFSTKLVVGIFNQSIKAFELILGIKDKESEILSRKKLKNSKPVRD